MSMATHKSVAIYAGINMLWLNDGPSEIIYSLHEKSRAMNGSY